MGGFHVESNPFNPYPHSSRYELLWTLNEPILIVHRSHHSQLLQHSSSMVWNQQEKLPSPKQFWKVSRCPMSSSTRESASQPVTFWSKHQSLVVKDHSNSLLKMRPLELRQDVKLSTLSKIILKRQSMVYQSSSSFSMA
jgi:hypothetical protein